MSRSVRLFIALALSIASSPTLAGSLNAVLNGKSYHIDSSYDWNEENVGLGLEYEFEQSGAWRTTAMANGFRDSTDKMSYMAGAGLHRRLFETEELNGLYVYAGINAFLMTRDDVNGNRPFPGLLPSISVGNRAVGLNLTYLPRKAVEQSTNTVMVDPTIDGILFLQFKVRIDLLLP